LAERLVGNNPTRGPSARRHGERHDMTTLLNELIETGDVIELVRGDDVVTAMVLLAADEAVILDTCDGSMPFVVKRDELVEYRKFDPSI
jgi:hypothetical protein